MSLHPFITFTRTTTATYFDSDGVLQTAAVNAPRWEYDPVSHVLRGVLVEEQRTNLALNSSTLSSWTVNGTTATVAAGIAPDGTNTMVRYAETATSAAHMFSLTATPIATTTVYTCSIFAKAAEVRYLQLSFDDGSGAHGFHATFDLQTGVVSFLGAVRGTGVLQSAAIIPVGYGIYRCAITGSVGTGTNGRFLMTLSQIGNPPVFAPSYLGSSALGLLAWGGQIEAGAYMTSYIPTTSASVVRGGDVPVMPPWFNTTVGSMSIEWITGAWNASGSGRNAGLLTLDDGAGTRANAIDCFAYTNGTASQQVAGAVRVSGADSSTITSANQTIPLMRVNQAAISWNNSAMMQSYNGAILSATASGVPTGMTRLSFGNGYAGVGPLGGYLRKATSWSRVLSEVELQTATLDPVDFDLMVPGSLDPRITFTRASIGTYFDVNGVMQTAGINVPRWDYDPATKVLRGLLVEEQRSNLIFPSVPEVGLWTSQGAVSLGGSVTAPDGSTSTTSQLRATDTSSAVRAYGRSNTAITPGGATYTVTAFFKRDATNAYIQVNTLGFAQVASVAYYDLTNGTALVGADLIAGLTGKSATITPITNGWYRASFTFINGTLNTSLNLFIGPCMVVSATGDNRGYPGVVDQGVYVWGVQLEAGSMATSYIPAYSAAVTRSPDMPIVSSVPGINNVANSLATDYMVPYSSMVASTAWASGQLDDGLGWPYNNCYTLRNQPTNGVTIGVFSNNASVGSATAGTFTPSTVMRQVAAFDGKALTGATALNGQAPVPFTFTAAPAPMVRLLIGLGRTSAVNGWMQRARYWPRVLSNAEMQAVTLDTPRTPSLNLDFLTPGSLDPRIVFTRASTGTYFDSAGVMRNAATNLVLQSQFAASWQVGGGVLTANAVASPDGAMTAATLREDTITGLHNLSQSITKAASSITYTMSIYVKQGVGTRNISFQIDDNVVSGVKATIDATTGAIVEAASAFGTGFTAISVVYMAGQNGWGRIAFAFTSNTGTTLRLLPIMANGVNLSYAGDNTSIVQLYGAQLEQGNAATPYIPTTTVTNSAPRWDYDPASRVLKGLLIEEQRTNVQFPSVNFHANATVSAGLDGVVQNAATAPDGTMTATRFIPAGSNMVHQGYTLFAGVVSTTYSFTLYMKADGYSYVSLQLENTAFAITYVGKFDLSAGTVVGGSAAGTTIQPVGNGWYRCFVTGTSDADGGNYVACFRVYTTLAELQTWGTCTGNMTSGVLVWGKQVEAGAFPTSYIPTTSAVVTRANDECYIPTTGWHNLSAFSYLFEVIQPVNTDSRYGGIGDTNFTNAIYSGPTFANSFSVTCANVGAVTYSDGPVALGSINKLVTCHSSNLLKLCGNSSSIGANASSLPVTAAWMSIGGDPWGPRGAVGAGAIDGWIRNVRYWPRALSNAEMKEVTQPSTTPTLDLDFLTPGWLDGRIAFTRASTATYIDGAGVMQLAAINTPRWDYDPVTHVLRGLLLEDARQNAIINSDTTLYGGTGVTSSTDIPRLLASATLWKETWLAGVQNGPVFALSLAVTDGNTYAASCWVYIPSAYSTSVDGLPEMDIDSSGYGTGAVFTLGVADGTKRNQWQRIVSVVKLGTGAGTTVNLLLRRGGAQIGGSTFYCTCPQFELADFASSYIPTAAVAVTRSIDSCIVPPTNMGWFNGTGGSWFAEFNYLDATPTGGRVIGQGSSGPYAMAMGATRIVSQYDGTSPMVDVTVTDGNSITKAITTWTPGQAKICANGGNVTTSDQLTTGYGTFVTNGIRFMSVGGVSSVEGCLRRVKYWPRILPNVEMQAVTAFDPPTLNLNFMSPGSLDQRITFTRASTATYTASDGTIRSAALNEPRWDYNPSTLQLRGLLIEEARTNICINSIPITNWSPLNTVMTPASGTAPDGTNSLARMAETAAGSNLYCSLAVFNITGGQAHTVSVYAKAQQNRYLQINLDNNGPNGTWATYDLVGGIVSGPIANGGTSVGIAATIQSVGNGIYRCIMSVTPTGPTARIALVLSNIQNPGLFPNYVGNPANGLLVWGVQLELGAFPTSYIPTTGAAVTRAADVCSLPTGPWYNATIGSAFYEYIVEGVALTYSAPAAFVGANAGNDHILIDQFAPGTATSPLLGFDNISVAGTTTGRCDFPNTPMPANTVQRAATAWAIGALMRGTHNNVTAVPNVGNTTALPVIVGLSFGGTYSLQPAVNQWARGARYWNRALSANELLALTS